MSSETNALGFTVILLYIALNPTVPIIWLVIVAQFADTVFGISGMNGDFCCAPLSMVIVLHPVDCGGHYAANGDISVTVRMLIRPRFNIFSASW